jgi:hypothetical protein
MVRQRLGWWIVVALLAAGCAAQTAFDDVEQCHPPSAALDYLLYDVVSDLVPDDDDAGFGQTWVDHVVSHADRHLAVGPARWVRLAGGLATDEYQLGNAELEAIERVRGGIQPDRNSNLVTPSTNAARALPAITAPGGAAEASRRRNPDNRRDLQRRAIGALQPAWRPSRS